MASDLNRVSLIGRLGRDAETRDAGSTTVTNLRLAVNSSQKQGDEWVDRVNWFDVNVWGKRGETVQRLLSKGSRIAVDGRLQWREWTSNDGTKHQRVDVVADNVQFLDGKTDASTSVQPSSYKQPDVAIDETGLQTEDIPF